MPPKPAGQRDAMPEPPPAPAPPKGQPAVMGQPLAVGAGCAMKVAPQGGAQVEGDFNGDGIPDHLQPKAMLRVVAPPNCYPGQTIHVRSDDGQLLPVTIPPGVGPGQALHIKYTPKQANPVKQELRVTAPPNTFPGMQLQVRAPDGQLVALTIPPGIAPGQTFIAQ